MAVHPTVLTNNSSSNLSLTLDPVLLHISVMLFSRCCVGALPDLEISRALFDESMKVDLEYIYNILDFGRKDL